MEEQNHGIYVEMSPRELTRQHRETLPSVTKIINHSSFTRNDVTIETVTSSDRRIIKVSGTFVKEEGNKIIILLGERR